MEKEVKSEETSLSPKKRGAAPLEVMHVAASLTEDLLLQGLIASVLGILYLAQHGLGVRFGALDSGISV